MLGAWRYLRRLLSPRPQAASRWGIGDDARQVIVAFAAEGKALYAECLEEQRPAPVEAAGRWAERVELVLLGTLGPAAVWRFRAGSGPLTATAVGGEAERVVLWRQLRGRIAALDQFIAERGAEPAEPGAAADRGGIGGS